MKIETNKKNETTNEIKNVFENLKKKKEKAFIPFLTIGDPNPEQFIEIIKRISPYSDIIELGIPFSDPLVDGRTIQKANHRALSQYITLNKSFSLIRKVKEITNKPIVLLTYANIIGLYEEQISILKAFAESGVNGIIIADVPAEEISQYKTIFKDLKIDNILLATQTTNEKRLPLILENAGGFLYIVSRPGVTGTQKALYTQTTNFILRISKKINKNPIGTIPLCVGFGISNKNHVKKLCELEIDGVIVGSAIIEIIEHNLNTPKKMLNEIEFFVKSLKAETFAQNI